jgi:hypothetical protein
MRFSRKSILVLVVLLVSSMYITVYSLTAYYVAARHMYEDPDSRVISWNTGPSGSLFPWPKESGMLEVLSKVSDVDLFIYKYLVKTWVLIGLSILMWVATGLSAFEIAQEKRAGKLDIRRA